MVVCGLAVVNLLYAREVVIRAKVPPGWGRLLLSLFPERWMLRIMSTRPMSTSPSPR